MVEDFSALNPEIRVLEVQVVLERVVLLDALDHVREPGVLARPHGQNLHFILGRYDEIIVDKI